MIYIAGPFFNERQLMLIKDIEKMLDERGLDYFSPRLEGGVLKDMTPEDREQAFADVYYSNVNAIVDCEFVLAVIDDFDAGTMFEIGFAAGIDKTVITLTGQNYGLNVMLAVPVMHHFSSIYQVGRYLGGESFTQFEPEVVT